MLAEVVGAMRMTKHLDERSDWYLMPSAPGYRIRAVRVEDVAKAMDADLAEAERVAREYQSRFDAVNETDAAWWWGEFADFIRDKPWRSP